MIALRKDVKVGFMIGGVVLGVFGVYLGLSALAGPKPDASATGASLQITPFSTVNTSTALTDRTPRSYPQTPAKIVPELSAPQRANQATANPTQPLTVDTNPGDIWGNAFETGKIQPVVTVTPDPNNLPPGNNTAKPADVISALNTNAGSEAANSAKATEAPTQTASAAEPSGSMANQITSSLTKPTTDPSPSAGEVVQTHSIEVGETFSSISANYYGDAKYFQMLVEANPNVDPNRLKPGTVIKVPALASRGPRSDTTDVPAENRLDPTKHYVVKSGDSLSRIASTLYGDSSMWQQIYDLNKSTIGDSPAKLKLGMVLSLPAPPTR